MNWSEIARRAPIRLNLGGGADNHSDARYPHYISVDFRARGEHSIAHDLTTPIPLPNGSVERILSEHFLEHIDEAGIVHILGECHRLLQPGGVARLAVPDYHSPHNRRALAARFDPEHTDHLTFPTYPLMRDLVARSPFRGGRFYQYWDGEQFVHAEIDDALGFVKRTVEHDPRNRCDSAGLLVWRTLRDSAIVISRGLRMSRTELSTQRYHPLRVTSIVIDLTRTP